MRIALIAPHIKIPGESGAAVHHMEFTKALAKLGNEIHIFADSGKEIKLDRTIYIHPSVISNIPPKRFLTSLMTAEKIEKICKEKKIQIIHDRCDPGQIAGYRVAEKLRLPRVAEINENQLSYEIKGNFLRDILTYPLLIKIKKLWIKKIVSAADEIVCVSNVIKSMLIRQGATSKKIEVIRNGANPEKFRTKINKKLRKKYKADKDDLVLTIIGELGPRQGIKEAVYAVEKMQNKIPNLKLILVGKEKRYEKYINSIKNYTKNKKVQKKIVFIDKINHEEIPKFLSTVDFALAPYRESWNNESFGFCPIKILEYMTAGKTVIATDTKWTRELIEDKREGFLVPIENFANELENILTETNPKMRKKIEKNARKKILKEFTWLKVAKKYEKIYKKLILSSINHNMSA